MTDTLTPGQHKLMLHAAVAHMRRLNERRTAYEQECQRDYDAGYTPHYCIHGTNRWTDYDNICGSCEDSLDDRELALRFAADDIYTWNARIELANNFHTACKSKGQDTGSTINNLLWEWASESIDILRTHKRPTRKLP